MLIEFLIKIIVSLLSFINFLLPNWKLPETMLVIPIQFSEFSKGLGYFLPMDEIFSAILLIILFETSVLTFRTITGIVSIIRGGGKIDV